MRSLALPALLGLLGTALLACASATKLAPPHGERSQPAERLLLIGDAGEAENAHLARVTAWLAREAVPTTVVFLGDNYYPQDERAIADVLEPQKRILATPRDVFFVPGNHDWHRTGHGTHPGRSRVRALASNVGENWQPPVGSLGPALLATSRESFRVIAIDSERWRLALEACGSSPCPTVETAETALEELLHCDGCAPAIVVAHHPLVSQGRHGGCLGSVRLPWLRLSNQDLAAPLYRAYVKSVGDALKAHPPLLFAAGHDHSLQWDRDSDYGAHGVSGSARETTAVCGPRERSWQRAGFMTVDFSPGEAPVLRVWAEDEGAIREIFSEPLARR